MLSLVTAAEHQYRFDASTRARENAIIAAIRHRQVDAMPPAPVIAVRTRSAWARPIGVRIERAPACDIACATA